MPVGGKYDAILNIGAKVDTSQLYNQIAAIGSRIPAVKVRFNDNGSLGRISKDASEFQRSLQAANARVVAFSASAGALYTISRAFREIVKSTVEVEKALKDINVVLQLSDKSLYKFSSQLFEVANKTGQSFKTASKAALEFSRQGLSTAETLKRTSDALTLVRFSNIKAEDAVASITATLNGFNDVLLDSTKLVNKLVAVDQSFAVSVGDLVESFERVGSTAKDTGVSIDSLIAIVTSAKQVTGRDGPVIGNALKTIFQRIQRTDTTDALEQLGIQVRNLSGELLPADALLKNIARSFQTASTEQRNFITQLAAGVFQSNQFRAILSDLGKENSIYSRVLQTSANATNQAQQRQLELNKTLSASINELSNNAIKAASEVGKISIEPTLRRLVRFGNLITEGIGKATDGEGLGGQIGKGLLSGLGNFLSGPGIVLAGSLLAKLFGNFGRFATGAFTQILEASSQEFRNRQAIDGLVSRMPGLQERVNRGAMSQLQIQNEILASLQREQIELARIGQLRAAASSLINTGTVIVAGGVANLNRRNKAVGHIPEIQEKIGAYAGGYTPGAVKEMNIPKLGRVYYNTAERVRQFPGLDQPAIIPPQASKAGVSYKKEFEEKLGFNPYKSEGLVPNFARVDPTIRFVQTLRNKKDLYGIGKVSNPKESYMSFFEDAKKKQYQMGFMNSVNKGDAYQMFQVLAEQAKSKKYAIVSNLNMLQPGRVEGKSFDSNWDRFLAGYPQLRYRLGTGKTSGVISPRYSSFGKKFEFKDLESLKNIVNENALDPFLHTPKQLKTTFSKGLVPNFSANFGLRAAAIKYGGKTYTGQLHYEAYEKIMAEHPEVRAKYLKDREEASKGMKIAPLYGGLPTGYLTRDGAFVSKEKAKDNFGINFSSQVDFENEGYLNKGLIPNFVQSPKIAKVFKEARKLHNKREDYEEYIKSQLPIGGDFFWDHYVEDMFSSKKGVNKFQTAILQSLVPTRDVRSVFSERETMDKLAGIGISPKQFFKMFRGDLNDRGVSFREQLVDVSGRYALGRESGVQTFSRGDSFIKARKRIDKSLGDSGFKTLLNNVAASLGTGRTFSLDEAAGKRASFERIADTSSERKTRATIDNFLVRFSSYGSPEIRVSPESGERALDVIRNYETFKKNGIGKFTGRQVSKRLLRRTTSSDLQQPSFPLGGQNLSPKDSLVEFQEKLSNAKEQNQLFKRIEPITRFLPSVKSLDNDEIRAIAARFDTFKEESQTKGGRGGTRALGNLMYLLKDNNVLPRSIDTQNNPRWNELISQFRQNFGTTYKEIVRGLQTGGYKELMPEKPLLPGQMNPSVLQKFQDIFFKKFNIKSEWGSLSREFTVGNTVLDANVSTGGSISFKPRNGNYSDKTGEGARATMKALGPTLKPMFYALTKSNPNIEFSFEGISEAKDSKLGKNRRNELYNWALRKAGINAQGNAFKYPLSLGYMNKGLVPNFANPKDKFLNYLRNVNPEYVKQFRGLQNQDTGLAKFLRNSADLKDPSAMLEWGKLLKKNLIQLTPAKYGLTTTTYANLNDSTKDIRSNIGGVFEKFGMAVPNFAGRSYLSTKNSPIDVRAVGGQLSNIEKRVLFASRAHEMGNAEIASMLKIPIESVSTILENATKKFTILYGQAKKGKLEYSGGLIPNFNALNAAVLREHSAGIPLSQIKIGQSSYLKNTVNPLGLGVYNTKHEPMGLNQGISRALTEGKNPKTYGVPNFALNPDELNYRAFTPRQQRQEVSSEFKKFAEQIRQGTRSALDAVTSLKSLAGVAKLLPQELNKINSSFIQLEKAANARKNISGSSLSGLTGDLFGSQLGFSDSGNQGEFIGVTQQAEMQTRNRRFKKSLPSIRQQILNDLISRNPEISNYFRKNQDERFANNPLGFVSGISGQRNNGTQQIISNYLKKTSGLESYRKEGERDFLNKYGIRDEPVDLTGIQSPMLQKLIARSKAKREKFIRENTLTDIPAGTFGPSRSAFDFEEFKKKIISEEQVREQRRKLGGIIPDVGQIGPSRGQFDLEEAKKRFKRQEEAVIQSPFKKLGRFASGEVPQSRTELAAQLKKLRAAGNNLPEEVKKEYLNELREVSRQTIASQKLSANELSASKKLSALQNSASSYGGLGQFFGKGRKAYDQLLKDSPEAARGVRGDLQNKAFNISFVSSMVGGLAQEGFGTDTANQRGLGQSAAGLSNIASFAATGFTVGGPKGALAGLGLGAILEVPKALKAFSDTLPDLQKRLGELQDTTQKTISSFASFNEVSQKMFEINSGNANVTNGQYRSLQKELATNLNNLPPSIRAKISRAAAAGQFGEVANISDINTAQELQRLSLGKDIEDFTLKSRANSKSLSFGERFNAVYQDVEGAGPVLRTGATLGALAESGLSYLGGSFDFSGGSSLSLSAAARGKEQGANNILRSEAKRIGASIFNLQNKDGKSARDLFTKEDTDRVNEAFRTKDFEDAVGEFTRTASNRGIDTKQFSEFFKEGIQKEDRAIFSQGFNEAFNDKTRNNQIKDRENFDSGTKKLVSKLAALEYEIEKVRKGFGDFGTSLEIKGIKALSKLSSNLNVENIRASGAGEIDLLSRGGANLSEFYQTQEALRTNRGQLKVGELNVREEASNQIFKAVSNARNATIEKVKKQLEKAGDDKLSVDNINKSVELFDKQLKPFLDIINSGGKIDESLLNETYNTLSERLKLAGENIKNSNTDISSQSKIDIDVLPTLLENLSEIRRSISLATVKNLENFSSAEKDILTKQIQTQLKNAAVNRIGRDTNKIVGNLNLESLKLRSGNELRALSAGSLTRVGLESENDRVAQTTDLINKLIKERPDLRNSGFNVDDFGSQLQSKIANSEKNIKSQEDSLIQVGNNFEIPEKNRLEILEEIGKQLKSEKDLFELLLNTQQEYNEAKEQQSAIEESNLKKINEQFKLNIRNLRSQGVAELGLNKRQFQLEESGLGKGSLEKIKIEGQKRFEGGVASIVNESRSQNPFIRNILDGASDKNTGALDLEKFNKELKKYQSLGDELIGDGTKESKDIYRELLEISIKIGQSQEQNNEQSRQQTVIESRLLKLTENRLNNLKEINQENVLNDKFDLVKGNLGNTIFESFSFNANDFWSQMADDAADFGEIFKGSFKNGINEAITGAKSVGDAFRGIGLSIFSEISGRLSNLAIDQAFGALAGNQSNLLGGKPGLLSGLLKSQGGAIPKFARGGFVNMGSGMKDDVPALLSGGEFVIKKSSVNKIGVNNLKRLNSDVPGPKATDSINMSNNSIDALLANEYYGYGSKKRPTKGEFNTSPLLSSFALTDENNPMNALKFSREKYFVDLKQYEYQKQKALKEFEKQQNFNLAMAYVSAGINFAGASLSTPSTKQLDSLSGTGSSFNPYGFGNTGGTFSNIQKSNPLFTQSGGLPLANRFGGFKNGGLIRRFAMGGSVFGGDTLTDNVPAMLMGGEFVMSKNSAERIGIDKLNYMNKTGRVNGYAAGGYVGNYSPTSYSDDNFNKQLVELVNINAQIRDSLVNKNSNTSPAPVQSGGGINITNQITVTISDSGKVSSSSNSQSSNKEGDKGNGKNNNEEQGKAISKMLEGAITQALIKESKNGGILESTFKKR